MIEIHGFGNESAAAPAPATRCPPHCSCHPELSAPERAYTLSQLDPGRVQDELGGAIETIANLSRRSVLKAGAMAASGAILAPFLSLFTSPLFGGEGDGDRRADQFVFPRLQFTVKDGTPDGWDVGPSGDVILRRRLKELTNVDVSMDPKVVRLSDFDDMCRNPFVFMTSEGDFTLPEREEANLREFLVRGGFIHSDDCVFKGQDRFFQSYLRLMNKLFPGNPMRKIPLDHEVFSIFFKFPKGCPHMQGVNNGAYGLFEPGTGRLMTIATPGDLHCGWMSRFFGAEKDMESIKMGLNIIIYYLTH